MHEVLLKFHSFFRWLVLISLLTSLINASVGYRWKKSFSKTDNALRHWTATIAHLQLLSGVLLYIKSPVVQYFWKHIPVSFHTKEVAFFGLYHIVLMLTSVIIITIGSALAKRSISAEEKYKTMLVYFGLGLLLILLAIPWPFSPLAYRPYFRQF